MTLHAADVERALLALAPDDRAAVIERGLLSLDSSDESDPAGRDEAWLDEINRRVHAYTSGNSTLVDAGAHLASVRARLAAHP